DHPSETSLLPLCHHEKTQSEQLLPNRSNPPPLHSWYRSPAGTARPLPEGQPAVVSSCTAGNAESMPIEGEK
ncbi:MAG: hypothetical protein ACK54R_00190, partial [Pirellulaceae bacterium]